MTDQHRPVAPSVSLELDTDLRLLPQQLNLGKAELLTDALTLPFADIESRLGHYVLSASEEETQCLGKSMKKYLGRLNANPHIPLKFRLNVLNRFERELDLFDAEMTAAVLNAHKIGVMLVQQEARHDSSYYPTLVDMIANAIELAVKLLLINLEQYRAPSVIVTRQFFDLARLGLNVSAVMGNMDLSKTTPSKIARLHHALCNHEMIRKVDFFAHPRDRQQIILRELQCHIGVLTPHLCRSGDTTPPTGNGPFMRINLNRPNDPGRIITDAPKSFEYDCIMIPLDKLIARLNTAIRSVESVLQDQQMQKKALHTEQALDNTLIGGKAILAALRNKQRCANRMHHSEARIHIHFDLPTAIIKALTPTSTSTSTMTTTQPAAVASRHKQAGLDQTQAWKLIDFDPAGACLERIHTELLIELPGHLVGLNWVFGEQSQKLSTTASKQSINKDIPQTPGLGFIRWSRILKAGEQRIGIEFLDPNFKLAKAVMSGGSQNLDEKRTWPILVKQGTASHTVIFPATNVYKHMTFMVLQGSRHAYFKIATITYAGLNYTLCNIIPAKLR